MNKSIENRNNKGQLHGYQELYWNGKLVYKGSFNNGKPIVYREVHRLFSGFEKTFYI